MAAKQEEVIRAASEHALRVMRGFENEDVQLVIDNFRTAQIEIEARLAQNFSLFEDNWNAIGMQQGGRDLDLYNQINEVLADLDNDMIRDLESGMIRQFDESINHTAYGMDIATPPTRPVVIPSIPTTQVRSLMAQPFDGARFSQRIGNITDTMARDIQSSLSQSMINGENMRDATVRIRKILGVTNKADPAQVAHRAEVIFRSEIIRAQNMGRDLMYEFNGDLVKDDPEWVATGDLRVCKWCLRRDGLTLKEIEKAPSGGDPFGKSTNRPLHPQCRCTTAPRLKSWRELGIDMPEEFDDEDRAMRDEETGRWKFVPKESFDDWKKKRLAEMSGAEGR